MITKVTSKNKNLYEVLFENANATLGLTGDDTITSLDDYFSMITALVNHVDGDGNHDGKKYSFLPLDEPTFDINADTRLITVPSEFKKNGISVKGDHYAEVLYFTINRYFDASDFYDQRFKVVIQWEAPSGEKGVSLAVFKDVEVLINQNKMLFGWALTDKITHTSGAVKFSVRIYEMGDDNKLSYSFSTLTASAIINPGLDYQFNENGQWDGIPEYTEDVDHLKARLDNYEYIGVITGEEPEKPTWVIDIAIPEAIRDLDSESGTLSIEAKATGTGAITYAWHYKPVGGAETLLPYGCTVGDVYLPISGHYDIENEVYYTAISGGYEPVTLTIEDDGEDIPEGTYIKRQGITFTANLNNPVPQLTNGAQNRNAITGEYWVEAKNRVGKRTSSQEGGHLIIPGPAAVEVSLPATTTSIAYLNNGSTSLEAKATTDNALKDTISYDWGRLYLEDGEVVTKDQTHTDVLAANTKSTYAVNVDQADWASYDRLYTVEIRANRNGTCTDPAEIYTYRVTDLPHTPEVSVNSDRVYVDGNNTAIVGVSVTNAITDDSAAGIVNDGFKYVWCRYTTNPDDNEEQEGYTIIKMKADSTELNPYTSCNYEVVNDVGSEYYCRVYTIIGTEESAVSGVSDRIQIARG